MYSKISPTFASLSFFYIIFYISQDFPFFFFKKMLSFWSSIICRILINGNLNIWSVVLKITTLYLNILSYSHNSQRIHVIFFIPFRAFPSEFSHSFYPLWIWVFYLFRPFSFIYLFLLFIDTASRISRLLLQFNLIAYRQVTA